MFLLRQNRYLKNYRQYFSFTLSMHLCQQPISHKKNQSMNNIIKPLTMNAIVKISLMLFLLLLAVIGLSQSGILKYMSKNYKS